MTAAEGRASAGSRAASGPPTSRPPLRGRLGRKSAPYLFLAPFVVAFAVFLIFPLGYALDLSLYRTKLIGGRSFVGLENYQRALQDDAFWQGVQHVLAFGVIQVPTMLGLALVGALILDAGISRLRTLPRLVWFLPFAVPSVVAALMWGYLYGQAFGPIAQIFQALGLQPPAFITQDAVIPALANIATWQFTGYNMLILFAALKAIPGELYEAARVDGATRFQVATRIKIPLIAPALVLTFIFSIIGTLQLFNEPNVLRANAPSVITPNFTPNMYVYNLAFGSRQFDYAAAIAFTLAIVIAGLSALVIFFAYRRQSMR